MYSMEIKIDLTKNSLEILGGSELTSDLSFEIKKFIDFKIKEYNISYDKKHKEAIFLNQEINFKKQIEDKFNVQMVSIKGGVNMIELQEMLKNLGETKESLKETKESLEKLRTENQEMRKILERIEKGQRSVDFNLFLEKIKESGNDELISQISDLGKAYKEAQNDVEKKSTEFRFK